MSLEANLIPRRLIDEMMSRPSNDIYWLSNDDLYELSKSPPALEQLYLSKCGVDTRLGPFDAGCVPSLVEIQVMASGK